MHSIESHDSLSIIGVSTVNGFILLLQYDDMHGFHLLASYHLSANQIETIHFIGKTMTLIAADNENSIFHIEINAYDETDIKHLIQCESNMIDISGILIDGSPYTFVLCSDASICSGHIYRSNPLKTDAEPVAIKIPLKHFYSSMQFILSDRVLGIRQVSNIQIIDLYSIHIENGGFELNAVRSVETQHICGDIRFVLSPPKLFTFGEDGKLVDWHVDTFSSNHSVDIFDTAIDSENNVMNITCDEK